MNCKDIKQWLPEYAAGLLSGRAKAELERHMADCAGCRADAADAASVWVKLGELPSAHPSEELDGRIQDLIKAHAKPVLRSKTEGDDRGASTWSWLSRVWPRSVAMQLAACAGAFLLGIIGNSWTRQGATGQASVAQGDPALAELRSEVAGMKKLLTVSLLQQASATERLRGVEWSEQIRTADSQVLAALIDVVNSDPNVNVRLAAVDALRQFAAEKTVRRDLAESLAHQDSPLVQIELINLMVDLHDRESVTVIKTLLKNPALDQTVRLRAEWCLQNLG